MTSFDLITKLRAAIEDPWISTARNLNPDGCPAETVTAWQVRAVLGVVSDYEHQIRTEAAREIRDLGREADGCCESTADQAAEIVDSRRA